MKIDKILTLLLILAVAAFVTEAQTVNSGKKIAIINGKDLTDTQGKIINAHGGGFMKMGKYFYWIGENRHDNVLVSCYRSTDLLNWEFRGDLLTRRPNPELADANIERPKVIYNAKTKQFVMWMHYEKRSNYSLARTAVAVSADIEKPFTYQRSFRPFNNMSRDCTLFLDDDGSAYFFSSARENYDMMMYRLTDDFLDVKEQVATLWPGGHREAPAIVKRKGYYFMITSGCTGWAPNQAKYAVAKSIRGPWSELTNIADNTTYHSQSTYILPIIGKESTSYLYVGDRWDGKHYFNSKYIFLPLTFSNDTTMEMPWKDTCNINAIAGTVK
ncbi:MAG: beta-xylosidase [Bacteroidetes bacterium]|nr:beta-xylosidase [Bacteroidota bacterium]